jgi:hypothetical protein
MDSELDRVSALKRSAQSLLNKICPDNVAPLSAKIAELDITNKEELQLVINLIFKKALSEPHYCETYADLALSLKGKMSEFPSPDGGKPATFKTCLINSCQHEFQRMPKSFAVFAREGDGPDEVEIRRKKLKDRVLANMKFIGHLFLRQLITRGIVALMMSELALVHKDDANPEEHMIECICELLSATGAMLESTDAGKPAALQICSRLMDLKTRTNTSGAQVYSKRVQFLIQDVLEMRDAGWAKKVSLHSP